MKDESGEEGTAKVAAPHDGRFGEKGGLMWLEACIPRASDRELSCKGGLKLNLKEPQMSSLGETYLQAKGN